MGENDENAVQLVIDQVAVLEDGYLLLGHCEWTDEDWQNVRIDDASAYALDAAGNRVPLELSEEGSEDNAFAFKVASKDFVVPLTLHAENLLVWANGRDVYRFTFDAGSDPQIGQSWDISKELEIEGQKIIINNVTVVEQSDVPGGVGQAMGYAIEVDIPDGFNGFFWCKGQEESSSSWGQVQVVENRTIMESYSDALPYGKVACDLQNVQFQLTGFWQVEWQPSPDMQ